jgi:hypothetical protein
MFGVFNVPINTGQEVNQRSYEMIYRFKNFTFGCEHDSENDSDENKNSNKDKSGRSLDYDEFLRMDMYSTDIFRFWHRERGYFI